MCKQLCGMSLFLQWLRCFGIHRNITNYNLYVCVLSASDTVVNLCENSIDSWFSLYPIVHFVFVSFFDSLPAFRSPSSFSLLVNEFAHQNNCRFNLINRRVNQVKMCERWQRTKNVYEHDAGMCISVCLVGWDVENTWEMTWTDITIDPRCYCWLWRHSSPFQLKYCYHW